MTNSHDDVSAALQRARTSAEEALAAATESTAGTLVPTGPGSAMDVKARLATQVAAISQARKAALAAQSEAKELIERHQAELTRQMNEMALMLEPIKAQLALLNEGVWTINLYLGRDEELHTLATGTPAPASTPIHVRQQVLAMDEESALKAETGGIDIASVEAFDEWITSNPAHLAQVLPDERGVVAIMARRKDRDYGDPWSNSQRNEFNHQTWWLIRNGENLYRMKTDFQVGARLVPSKNEFTSMFINQVTGQPLEPGSDAWLKAEKRASARERHFMRIALILQGLVDRTEVFHPLPVAGLSLLSTEHYDAGHVVLIADDEAQITTGRKPFMEWLASKNGQLGPGMRVIVNVHHHSFPSIGRDGRHSRIYPSRAEFPRNTAVHRVTRSTSHGGLVISYPRTEAEFIGRGWDAELRVPKTPASCTIYPSDPFVLPVDLVTIKEMKEYLAARTERHAYAEMFPTLTAAIAFKEEEEAQEAPFRALLAGQIALADGTGVDEAASAVDDLVMWWKIANRWHRPLNGDPASEAKACRMILDEHAARRRALSDSAGLLATLRARHHDALFVSRKKDGSWVVGTASARRWGHSATSDKVPNVPQDVFIDLTEYTPTGQIRKVKEWQVPEPSTVARWTMLYTSKAYESWKRRARREVYLSDVEITDAIEELRAMAAPEGHQLVAITYREPLSRRDSRAEFVVWYQATEGPVAVSAPLTVGLPNCESTFRRYRWVRQDGRVVLGQSSWGSNGSEVWRLGHNPGIEPQKVGTFTPPWGTSSVVFLDEDVASMAMTHAHRWDELRRAYATLKDEAMRLFEGLSRAAVDRQIAALKVRFMEDYASEELWLDHVQTLKVTAPFTWWGSRHNDISAKVRYLVQRLVELGAPPYGLTVREAIDSLVAAGCEFDAPDELDQTLQFPGVDTP